MIKQDIEKLIRANFEMDCPLCGLQYSQKVSFPMILCNKQHVCCERCLNQKVFKNQYINMDIAQCPECSEIVKRHQVSRMNIFEKISNFRKGLIQKIDETHIKEKMEEQYNIKQDVDDESIKKLKNLEKWLLDQAQIYFLEDNYQQTIKICRKMIENNPSRKCNYVGFGSKEDFIGYEEEYIRQYYQSYMQKIEDRSPYDLLSLCILLSSDYQQDKRWFLQQLESNTQNYQIYFALGLLQANCSNYDEAITAFQKALRINRNFQKTQQCIAFLLYAKGNTKMAKRYAQSSLLKNQNNKYSLFIDVVTTQDQQQKIIKLTKVRKNYPQYLVPLFELGQLYFVREQMEQAISCFEGCLNKSKFFDSARINLAQCYLQVNQPEKAIEIFQDTTINDNQQAIEILAEAYSRVGFIEQTHKMIARCKEINPQNEKIQHILASVYELQQKYQDAIDTYKSILNKNPDNQQLYKSIAVAFLKKGDCFNAQEWNEQYMKKNPEDISIIIKIADYHYNEQSFQTALQHYLHCFEKSRQFTDFASKIINIYEHKHFFEQALHWAKKWNDIQPDNPDSWEALALISKTISDKIRSKEWQPKKKRHMK